MKVELVARRVDVVGLELKTIRHLVRGTHRGSHRFRSVGRWYARLRFHDGSEARVAIGDETARGMLAAPSKSPES